jgi:DNA-binding IclR family transcriptional regulator
VFNHTQQLQCVLTITEDGERLDERGRIELANDLRHAADAVSRAAGYSPTR